MTKLKSCIVLTFDVRMALPASVLIKSIIKNYFDYDDLDIVCAFLGDYKDIEYLNNLLKNVENAGSKINIKIIEINKNKFTWLEKLENINSRHHAPSSIDLCKLFLGSILSEYDKAIYLDADMIAVKNIQPILDYPIYNKLMAVVDTTGAEYYYLKSKGESPHINTGLMIIDLNWWRESKIEDLFIEHIQSAKIISMNAEELINTYAKPYWSPVPYSFNFYQFSRDKYGIPNYDESNLMPQHYAHAIIFHFVNVTKPWNFKEMVHKEDTSLLGEKWRRMAKEISTGLSKVD